MCDHVKVDYFPITACPQMFYLNLCGLLFCQTSCLTSCCCFLFFPILPVVLLSFTLLPVPCCVLFSLTSCCNFMFHPTFCFFLLFISPFSLYFLVLSGVPVLSVSPYFFWRLLFPVFPYFLLGFPVFPVTSCFPVFR